ncbi:hypothetical protein [Dialister invisus]|nr:hypothetical protein [Dialister invisus]MBS6199243.1 hypothetical protein [Dialister invisus]
MKEYAVENCHSPRRENWICGVESAGEKAETAAEKCSSQVVPVGLYSVRD